MFLVWVWVFISFHQHVKQGNFNTIFSKDMFIIAAFIYYLLLLKLWSGIRHLVSTRVPDEIHNHLPVSNPKNNFYMLLSLLSNTQHYFLLFSIGTFSLFELLAIMPFNFLPTSLYACQAHHSGLLNIEVT